MLLPEHLLLIPAIPIALWVSWSDMKFMRIPNVACLALFVSFLVLGFFIYDLHEYGIRILQGIVVLIIGFFATKIGLVGGGDSKFFAAMAPFIALEQSLPFIFIIGIMSLLSVGLHKIVGITPWVKHKIADWDSWNTTGMFPFGVTLATSLIASLVLTNFYS